MELNDLISDLKKSYESEYDFIKDFIDRGQLNSSQNNEEPGLADLIMDGKLRSECVEEIIDSYHIKAINNLLENSEKNFSNMSSKTIYIKKAGTLENCAKAINLKNIDELIIIGKINQKDLYWIFEMSNSEYQIKTLDLNNTIIESCEICFDPDGHDESVIFQKNRIHLGSTNLYPYIKKCILPRFVNDVDTSEIEYWSLSDIHVSNENIFYSSNDGVLYNKKQTKIICYPTDKLDISFTIPNTVISIGEDSFSGCKNLTSIVVLNSVPPSIDEDCFIGCSSIKDVFVPTDRAVIAYKTNANWIKFFPGDIIKKSISALETDQSINNVTLAKQSCVSEIIIFLKKILNL